MGRRQKRKAMEVGGREEGKEEEGIGRKGGGRYMYIRVCTVISSSADPKQISFIT